MNGSIETYVAKVVAAYKKLKPDWKPPHGVCFAIAEKMKFKAIRVNKHTHEFYRKNFQKLFDGELKADYLDGPIRVTFTDPEGDVCQVRFIWDDIGKVRQSGSKRSL